MMRKLELITFGCGALLCAIISTQTVCVADTCDVVTKAEQVVDEQPVVVAQEQEPVVQQEKPVEIKRSGRRLVAPSRESARAKSRASNTRFAATARKSRSMYTPAQTRAPRVDAPSASQFSTSDSALLAEIAACCCNLTNIVLACCSVTEGDCNNIGELDTPGICDSTLWSTVDGIQNAEQPVIGWLKTIMLELRGFCQPTP